MTEKYFKIRAIVMSVFIIVTFALFAVSCDKNSSETENSNTTTTTTTQVTTTTSDEDDVTTTARPKETTTTKATTTAVTTTTSDEEDVTTTTTMATTATNAQTTATTTKATTTTPQQTTVTTTTTTKQEVSENAEKVETLMQSIGITEDAEVIEQYVADATTLDEMYTALNNYANDTGRFSIDYFEQGIWDIQGCASQGIMYLIEVEEKICLVESADLNADTLTIDGVCMTYDQVVDILGENTITLSIY